MVLMRMRVGWKFVSVICGVLCATMDLLTMMDLILMLQEWCADNWDYRKMVSYAMPAVYSLRSYVLLGEKEFSNCDSIH